MNIIEKQYQTAKNLNTRISIHDKYSTNHQPFGDWIMSHYEIKPGCRILELGCGTGDMWKGKLSLLDGDSHLTLTDFSTGMLETAKKNIESSALVDFKVVDIQDIPYEDGLASSIPALALTRLGLYRKQKRNRKKLFPTDPPGCLCKHCTVDKAFCPRCPHYNENKEEV